MFRTVLFILAAVISDLITGRLVDPPKWLRSIDIPNQRSSHTTPTPRTGGLGMVVSFVLLLPLLWATILPDAIGSRFVVRPGLALLGLIVIAAVGLVDDVCSIRPLTKYLGQLLAALITIRSGVTFLFFDLPFIGRLDLSQAGPAGAVLTILWLTGFSNLFNFMDGIDGLAGGSGAIYSLALALVCLLTGHYLPATALLVLAAACLGFLRHNFPPARIFMGDVGSLFIGYTLAAFTVMITNSGVRPLPFLAAPLVFAPFLFDTISTMFLRWLRGERLHEAHRQHLYQRLVTAGQTHLRVTTIYYILNLMFAALGLCYLYAADQMRSLLLIAGLTILGGFTIYVRRAEKLSGRRSLEPRSKTPAG